MTIYRPTALEVYLVHHIDSGLEYVGMTGKGAEIRFRQLCSSWLMVGRAIRLCGKGRFALSVLHKTESREEASDLEREEILRRPSYYPHGLNVQALGPWRWRLGCAVHVPVQLSGRDPRFVNHWNLPLPTKLESADGRR